MIPVHCLQKQVKNNFLFSGLKEGENVWNLWLKQILNLLNLSVSVKCQSGFKGPAGSKTASGDFPNTAWKYVRLKNYGISSPESMTCIQDIRQAFNLRDTVQRVHGTANVSGSGNSFVIHFLAALTIMGCIPFREVNLNFVWHLAIWNTYQPWKWPS